jgi:hypothetical protein
MKGKTRRLLSNRPGSSFNEESDSKGTSTRQQLDCAKTLGNEVVLADDAVAVLHQVDKQIEHLRLDGNSVGPPPKLAPISIKRMAAKEKLHVVASKLSSNIQGHLKDKSRIWQSLPAASVESFASMNASAVTMPFGEDHEPNPGRPTGYSPQIPKRYRTLELCRGARQLIVKESLHDRGRARQH